jgi:hypothetical protein
MNFLQIFGYDLKRIPLGLISTRPREADRRALEK